MGSTEGQITFGAYTECAFQWLIRITKEVVDVKVRLRNTMKET